MQQQTKEKITAQAHLQAFTTALETGELRQIKPMLNGLPAADAAHLLESSPPKMRHILWSFIDIEKEGDILQELPDELQAQFLSGMDAKEVVAITEGLEADDIADILQQLPDRIIHEVLTSMDYQDRRRVESVLSFDEDSAGGLMNTDTISVRPSATIDVVLRYLRRHDSLPETTDKIFVVNRRDRFVATLSLSKIITADPSVTVREIMDADVEAIPAAMSASEVANLFERHDWVSAPVIDDQGKLLGRITIDDAVDVIIEDADHSLMSMAGLDEDEDTFAPVLKTAPRRAMWLGVNLLTAFIASAVINMFEGTIDKVVALAVLMPIVASMGGVAGTQTLTLVIRGIALGHIGHSNSRWLLIREVIVGAINGLFWAAVVALAAGLWFGDVTMSFIIAAAMIINLCTAAVAGTLLPLLLKRMNIDPALAGSVILTTVTDVVGFMSFLGLAAWCYG